MPSKTLRYPGQHHNRSRDADLEEIIMTTTIPRLGACWDLLRWALLAQSLMQHLHQHVDDAKQL